MTPQETAKQLTQYSKDDLLTITSELETYSEVDLANLNAVTIGGQSTKAAELARDLEEQIDYNEELEEENNNLKIIIKNLKKGRTSSCKPT